ncbi:hypothetical protein [Azospirillum palustre]
MESGGKISTDFTDLDTDFTDVALQGGGSVKELRRRQDQKNP